MRIFPNISILLLLSINYWFHSTPTIKILINQLPALNLTQNPSTNPNLRKGNNLIPKITLTGTFNPILTCILVMSGSLLLLMHIVKLVAVISSSFIFYCWCLRIHVADIMKGIQVVRLQLLVGGFWVCCGLAGYDSGLRDICVDFGLCLRIFLSQ